MRRCTEAWGWVERGLCWGPLAEVVDARGGWSGVGVVAEVVAAVVAGRSLLWELLMGTAEGGAGGGGVVICFPELVRGRWDG